MFLVLDVLLTVLLTSTGLLLAADQGGGRGGGRGEQDVEQDMDGVSVVEGARQLGVSNCWRASVGLLLPPSTLTDGCPQQIVICS